MQRKAQDEDREVRHRIPRQRLIDSILVRGAEAREDPQPRGDVRTIASNQGQNANDVYFAHLTNHSRKTDGYVPTFSYAKGSKKASQIRGKAWGDIMFEADVDVYEEDMALFASPMTSAAHVSEHFGFMLSEARRKTEVSLRSLTAQERRLMEEATDKEVDQWIQNSGFSYCSEEQGAIVDNHGDEVDPHLEGDPRGSPRPKRDLRQKVSRTQTS